MSIAGLKFHNVWCINKWQEKVKTIEIWRYVYKSSIIKNILLAFPIKWKKNDEIYVPEYYKFHGQYLIGSGNRLYANWGQKQNWYLGLIHK
jgi:hypothetical protein